MNSTRLSHGPSGRAYTAPNATQRPKNWVARPETQPLRSCPAFPISPGPQDSGWDIFLDQMRQWGIRITSA